MRRLLSMGLAALALSTTTMASATTLVDARGRPIGGSWQRWTDQARVPALRGRVVLSSRRLCDVPGLPIARGCSVVLDGVPTLAAVDREALYYELGHLFDWRVLAPADRYHLASIWHVLGASWADTDPVNEDGLAADFAAAYAACALGRSFTGLQSGDAPLIYTNSAGATCRVIRGVARLRAR